MTQQLESYIVAIMGPDGKTPIGTGFIVNTSGVILTAYHVVNFAVGTLEHPVSQQQLIRIRLPLTSVIVDAELLPEQSAPDSDIAVLRILRPPLDLKAAVLGPSEKSTGHTFVSAGYRSVAGGAVGTIAPPELEAKHGPFRRLILRTEQIDRGMSGAPVLDQHSDRVVGMITATWYGSPGSLKDHATSFAVPSEAILSTYPGIIFIQPTDSTPAQPARPHHNLPRTRRAINLRAAQLESLRAIYAHGSKSVLITGSPGIGKTRLACILAHELIATEDVEMAVWISDPVLTSTTSDVLDLIAGVLGLPEMRKLPQDEKELRLFARLSKLRVLIVLDGLDQIADGSIRVLIGKLPTNCYLLATSRRDSGIEFDETLALRPLSLSQSQDFLRMASLGRKLQAATDAELKAISQLTGGLPIALEWVVAQINSGRQTIESVMEAFERGVDSVGYSLYNATCDALSLEEMDILGALAFVPTGARVPLLTASTGQSILNVEQALADLINGSVVEPIQDLRRSNALYKIPRPLRAFIRSGRTEKTAIMTSAFNRIASFYEQYVDARSFMYKTNSDAYKELEDEYLNIEEVIAECFQRTMFSHAAHLCLGMSYFYAISGRWDVRIAHAEHLLSSARDELTVESRGWILINELGYMLISREDWRAALAAISSGQEILRDLPVECGNLLPNGKSQLRDEENVSFMHSLATRYEGLIVAGMGNPRLGATNLNRAIEGFSLLRRRTVSANTRIELGEIYLQIDDRVRGRDALQKAMDYHLAQVDDKPWVNTWIARGKLGLGEIALREKDFELALACFDEAKERSRIIGNVNGFATAIAAQARIHEVRGDFQEARDLACLAREEFLKMGRDKSAEDMTDLAVRCERIGW